MSVSRLSSLRRVLWAILASLASAAAARAGQPVASFNFDPLQPNVGTTVTFTDTSTENPTSWLWNFGDPTAGVLNTSELQNPFFTYNFAGTYTATLTVSNNDGLSSTTHTIVVSDSSLPQCVPSANTLCVGNGRFSVTTDWTKPDGTSGPGDAVQLTSDSGYFWFFQPSNTEVVVKVLNGCSYTGAYWVFAAGLTNVEVVLNVKDEHTGVIYTSTNPQGVAYVPVQDTGALPTSCP